MAGRTRPVRDHYVCLDSNDYFVHFPVIGPRTVVPGQSGKTNRVEHIPLVAVR